MRRFPGLEAHPHAAAVLGAALPPDGAPSHAYLFAGPAGVGKRSAARAFAAELLADGATDPESARARAGSGAHTDLTWVVPSGAHDMRREDVEHAVVRAAAHTPFESSRRVFVLERVDTMHDAVANSLLKTLEEPPSYVVLILLTDRPGQVMPTIVSRCQPVRFDPVGEDALAARLEGEGIEPLRARACARLSLGDGDRALAMAGAPGLREAAERLARAPLHGASGTRPWSEITDVAAARGAGIREELEAARDRELEMLPKKEQRRCINDYEDRIKRAERRARTGVLDHALQLAGLWYRDLACLAAGAPDLVHHADRGDALAADAAGRSTRALRDAVALVDETRASLALNVSEDLALEALCFRLERSLGSGAA